MALSKSKYGHFLVMKLITICKKEEVPGGWRTSVQFKAPLKCTAPDTRDVACGSYIPYVRGMYETKLNIQHTMHSLGGGGEELRPTSVQRAQIKVLVPVPLWLWLRIMSLRRSASRAVRARCVSARWLLVALSPAGSHHMLTLTWKHQARD